MSSVSKPFARTSTKVVRQIGTPNKYINKLFLPQFYQEDVVQKVGSPNVFGIVMVRIAFCILW